MRDQNSENKVIGVNAINYNIRKNISDVELSGIGFKKIKTFSSALAYLEFKVKGQVRYDLINQVRGPIYPKVKYLHLFNGLNYTKLPWISTFESFLPRLPENESQMIKGLNILAKENCKALLSMSKSAIQIQMDRINTYTPELKNIIGQKLQLSYPIQEPIMNPENKQAGENVIFTLIGTDFFRKGGLEILKAFDILYQRGSKNWKLNLITALQLERYPFQIEEKQIIEAKKLIAKYPINVLFHGSKTSIEVEEILKTTMIGLLPTYADTFGYSVLEAQAAGCPCITTNIRALPEINNTDIGWQLELPLTKDGNCLIKNSSYYYEISELLTNQLVNQIEKILAEPEQISKKASASYNNVLTHYSKQKKQTQFKDLYCKSFGISLN